MNTLIGLAIISSTIGVLTQIYIRTRFASFLAAFIPWIIFLTITLYEVYFIPYQGGGASMWPIALIFGGTTAAIIGFIAFKLTTYIRAFLHAKK